MIKIVLALFFLIPHEVYSNEREVVSKVIEASLSGGTDYTRIEGKVVFHDKNGVPKYGGEATLRIKEKDKTIFEIKTSHDGTFKFFEKLKRVKYQLEVKDLKCNKKEKINNSDNREHLRIVFKCH